VAFLCLGQAFLNGLAFPLTSPWFDALSGSLGLMHIAVSIWAIRVQRRGWWPPLLAAVPRFALTNLVLSLVLALGIGLAVAIRTGPAVQDIDWRQIPIWVTAMTLTSGFALGIGIIGVRELNRLRARLATEGALNLATLPQQHSAPETHTRTNPDATTRDE
jgi:hypothetical protein